MKKMIIVLSLALGLTAVSAGINETAAQTTKTKTVSSHKKKSTLIGAGAGAVTGAAVSNKRGKGAVIGGAIGAGAGYLYGRHRDKTHPSTKTVTKSKS
jgi:uncharacterized membrane protein